MIRPSKKPVGSSSILTKLFLLALVLTGGVSSSLQAQELVKGTFTLSAETRIGTTRLPAGHYTVSIEPVTALAGTGTRVLVFVRPQVKSGPVASVFAMASQEACDTPSGLTLLSDNTGLAARSLCLSKQGLMIDFDQPHSSETLKVKAAASVRP